MDVALLSTSMAQMNTQTSIGYAMLGKSLDTVETTGESMAKMLEQSVNPAIGGNIDISL